MAYLFSDRPTCESAKDAKASHSTQYIIDFADALALDLHISGLIEKKTQNGWWMVVNGFYGDSQFMNYIMTMCNPRVYKGKQRCVKEKTQRNHPLSYHL